ncbi:MAG: hypothetical protein NTX96_00065, partial [Candidatus Zambryskibacteria bacterium]|nr:hypothetical protein [Candidatus Zambryskibacteria bacterium]
MNKNKNQPNYIKHFSLFITIFVAVFFVFGVTSIHAASGTFNFGGPFPMTMNYSGLTPGGCDNGSENPSYSIDASNNTNDHYSVEIAAFHSNQAGCGAYDSTVDNTGWSISGTTEFPAHASGHFDMNYIASSHSCGRVQYDAGYVNRTTGEVTVFVGQVINYGVDCVSPPPSPPPPPPPSPTVVITANPTSVSYNGSSTLTWSSTNATSCTASGDWSGTKVISGSELQNNLTSNKNYTITCIGAGGSASANANVTVGAQPQIFTLI